MSHKIGMGTTWHSRLGDVTHQFTYPVAYLVLDLAKWGQKDSGVFSFDKWNLFSILNKDYLSKGSESLYSKVEIKLKEHGFDDWISKVWIHTSPRFLGFVFNPVNFYYCYQKDRLAFALVEINNTFGEKHTYCIKIKDGIDTYRVPKCFHVSPFNKIEGDYRFVFQNPSSKYQIHVDIEQEGQEKLLSGIEIEPKELTSKRLLGIAFQYPITLLATTFRIGVQAFKLYFNRGLDFYDKPKPSSFFTQVWTKPVLLQRILTGTAIEKLQKLIKG